MKNKISINFILHERYNYFINNIKEFIKLKKDSKDKLIINLLVSFESQNLKQTVDFLKINGIKVNAFKINGNNNYMYKIYTALENSGEYSISIDEDIFIPCNVWEYFINNISILDDNENLFLSPIVTNGIPSVDLFTKYFLNDDENNKLENIYLKTYIPNIWGVDYDILKENTINAKKWDSNYFYKNVNKIDHYYKGVHPVRFSYEAQKFLNDICISNIKKIVNCNDFSLLKIKRPYFCNSVFGIKTDTWKCILKDASLMKDSFDEVPLNLYMRENNLNMVFIDKGVAFHPSYNTVNVFGYDYSNLSNDFFKNEYFK